MNKFESNYTDPLSYSTIKNLIGQFRRSNGKEGSDFNKFETPGQYYFKILFYFNNPGQDALTSNLLGCDWINEEIDFDEQEEDSYIFTNSAYHYLVMNDEIERSEMLKKFIYLLSDINSQSPWYWQSISGLDTALERKVITETDFKLEDRKSIVIKCLPDAYDNRIGTLIDLYRSICYSYTNKKEIVPANLRKFDMGIYIFNTPMYNDVQDPYISADLFRDDTLFRTSSKYIELHNCEIDYNSSKTGYADLNNADGKSNEYSITIFFDDAYENRYNEFVTSNIGDFIKLDLIEQSKQSEYNYMTDYYNKKNKGTRETQKQLFNNIYTDKTKRRNNTTQVEKPSGNLWDVDIDENDIIKRGGGNNKWPNELTNNYIDKTRNSFLNNVIDQTVGHVSEKLKTLGKSIYLGNLYGLSLSKVRDQVKDVMSGNLFNTVNAIQDYVEHVNREKGEMESLENRTLWEQPLQMVEKPDGNLWEQPLQMNNKPSGNLWDVDTENDIIKRGQKSSLLNTKRSLFQ